MKYATVCSGIEAPTVAWHELGWQPQWFSEIEPLPCAVLAHHYHGVPNLGDMTTIGTDATRIDLLCGGTPCQDLSIGGRRVGWRGRRSGLAWEFARIAECLKPQWFVWENVVGCMQGRHKRGFLQFIGALMQCGYGVAWRVLDARYFGCAQTRKRVFAVGSLGSQRSAKVLLESEGMPGIDTANPAPAVSVCLTARGAGSLDDRETYVVDASERVRHMTPREFERCMGFPDDYTLVPYRGKPAADTPRYKAIGNSMAVPVMRWIGERIQQVDSLGHNMDT